MLPAQAAKDAEKAAKLAKFAAKQAAADAAKAAKAAEGDKDKEDKKAKEKAEAEAKKVGGQRGIVVLGPTFVGWRLGVEGRPGWARGRGRGAERPTRGPRLVVVLACCVVAQVQLDVGGCTPPSQESHRRPLALVISLSQGLPMP